MKEENCKRPDQPVEHGLAELASGDATSIPSEGFRAISANSSLSEFLRPSNSLTLPLIYAGVISGPCFTA
jgi:hypothetical protein